VGRYARRVSPGGGPLLGRLGARLCDSGYPYVFIDGNGVADADEMSRSNRYNAFTPRLLQATYNYHYVVKDPGAYVHNGKYVIQVLYDSLEDLGADTTGMVRP